MERTEMTKGEFAAFVGRTPAAVSQWIARGKLSSEALIGDGRTARINVPVAMRQLAATLDMGQQLRQAAPIDAPAPPASLFDVPAPKREPGLSSPGGRGEDVHVKARYSVAAAEYKEQQVELGRIQLAKEAGRWTDREKVELAYGRRLVALMGDLDNHHHTLVDVIAVEMGVDRSKLRILVRAAWRKTRTDIANALAKQAVALPELVEAP